LLGGNDFHGLIQTEPAGGPPGSAILRQADFSLCLLHPELDELREIQNAINCKRPRTGELEEWSFVTFGYFGLEDVRAHLAFLSRRFPDLVARFVEGRVAVSNAVPQPAFMARLKR
jgi:hypothetical protein